MALERESCPFGVSPDDTGVEPFVERRARAAGAVGLEIDDADPATGYELVGDVAQERDGIGKLRVGVDDEHGLQAGFEACVRGRPEHGRDVAQLLAFDAAADRFDHLRLDVFGEHPAVRPDPARQADREPAAARADVGDAGAVRDLQQVHDAVRLLPLVAIRRLEQDELFRREQTPGRIPLRRRLLGEAGKADEGYEQDGECSHRIHRIGSGRGPRRGPISLTAFSTGVVMSVSISSR